MEKMLFEKHKMQTAQPKVSATDVERFIIPILPEEKQTEIQQKVRKCPA